MASIFKKRGSWWARLKGDKTPGKWSSVPTGYALDDEKAARRFADEAQKAIDERNSDKRPSLTFRAYVKRWLEQRQESGHDWTHDRGRLTKHVLPTLGDRDLAAIRPVHLAELVHRLRFKAAAKLAPRTLRN